MLKPRIIPCLLIHKRGLVKTVQFGTPKYVGDPINTVRIFNEKAVDELIVLDIDATAKDASPDFQLIETLAAECRMPLAYGGGVKTTDQAKRIFALGVEKIAISSAAIEDPDIVTEIANAVGRQSVVVVLDVRGSKDSTYRVFTHNGKKQIKRDLASIVREVERLGAGEIVVNSIDRDGTMKGYDLDLAREVSRETKLPLTFLGGAGSLQDIGQLIRNEGIVGAAAGSLFVFKGSYKAVLISYPSAKERADIISANMEGIGVTTRL